MILACMLMMSCGGNGRRASDAQTRRSPQPLTLPTIPTILTNPEERADFLVKHYWDNFDFTDTLLVGNQLITEQAFVDFLNILPHVSEATMRTSIHNTLDRAIVEPKMFACFADLYDKYLFNPNAPMRNEELYSIVLEYILSSPKVDEFDKDSARLNLSFVNKNRPGAIATDFIYTMANGVEGSLFKIKSEFLIIFFNNPGCSACAEYQQGLTWSPVISQMMELGRLKILAMYVDEEIENWKANHASMPTTWIDGYDASTIIRKNQLYDLRAIPNLYLLDKEKRVILKDAMPNVLEETLLHYLQNAN